VITDWINVFTLDFAVMALAGIILGFVWIGISLFWWIAILAS